MQVKVFQEETTFLADRESKQCDYLLHNKAEKYISVIEAKDRRELKQKWAVQCILQLTFLTKVKEKLL